MNEVDTGGHRKEDENPNWGESKPARCDRDFPSSAPADADTGGTEVVYVNRDIDGENDQTSFPIAFKGGKGNTVEEVPDLRMSQLQQNQNEARQRQHQLLPVDDETPTLRASARSSPATLTRTRTCLYDRERETRELLQAYGRATTQSCSGASPKTAAGKAAAAAMGIDFTLITGSSGSGKSCLVYSVLEERVQQAGGFLLTAKYYYDQVDQPQNYAPLIRAFTDLVTKIKARHHDKALQKSYILAIQEAVNQQPLLLDIIPALRDLLPLQNNDQHTNHTHNSNINTSSDSNLEECEHQDHSEHSNNKRADEQGAYTACTTAAGALGQNTRKRLCFAFQTFVNILCSLDRPLVLFCDDLQWAEPASLDLLAAVVGDAEKQGIFLVGSCRDNEIVSTSHPLAVMLRELEADAVRIQRISLRNLQVDAVRAIVATDYGVESTFMCEKLSGWIMKQTGGNALYVVFLLRSLDEEGLLNQYDIHDIGHWERHVEETFHCTDSVQLIRKQLEGFDESMQELLMMAACLGSEFHSAVLYHLLPCPLSKDRDTFIADIEEKLALVQKADLVQWTQAGVWRFTHDQVQSAAYSLITEEIKQLHLSIGTKLWKNLDEEEMKIHSFTVISQLGIGAHLISDQNDRNQMSVFLLRATRGATASSAFRAASTSVNLGIELLGNRHWRDEYELSLGLYNAAIEVEYCNGDYSKMESLTNELVENARRTEDTHLALTNGVLAAGIGGDFQTAISRGVSLLDSLGFTIPSNPGVFTMLWEYSKTKKALKQYSDSAILNLPIMEDPGKLMAMRTMVVLFTYMINLNPLQAIVVVMKLVRTVLKGGLSPMAAPTLSFYACLLCGGFRDMDSAMRYSKLSLDILEMFDSKEWLSRTYFGAHGLTFPHIQPWKESLKPMLTAHRIALATGDFEYAMHSAGLYLGIALAAGVPLEVLWSDTQVFLQQGKSHPQASVDHFLKPQAQFAANLMGDSSDPTILTGAIMDEARELKDASDSQKETNTKVLQFQRLKLKSFFHAYRAGEPIATQLMDMQMEDLGAYAKAPIIFHSGLVVAGAANSSSSVSRKRLSFVKMCLARLRALSFHAPGENCSMVLALEAVLALMKKRFQKADQKFLQSLTLGRKQGFVDVVGVVNEHFADSLLGRGEMLEALAQLEQAAQSYGQWGAKAKVKDVENRISEMKCKTPLQVECNPAKTTLTLTSEG